MLSSFLKFSKLVILEGKVWIYPRNISLENLYVPVASVWYLYKNQSAVGLTNIHTINV